MTDPSDATDLDPATYFNLVRAEIEAEAETRRRRDPELQRREREIERAWVEVAPPGAAGAQSELLLDRADRLAMIDVDAPLGARPGIRQAKGVIRKANYWYLRYVSDQINALNNVMVRLLRRLDRRMGVVEAALDLDDPSELIDPVPEPTRPVADAVARHLSDVGPAAVLTCGSGVVVDAISEQGFDVHGVDPDALAILPGVRDGLDLRVDDPTDYLAGVGDGSLGSVVVVGFIENLAPARAWQLIGEVVRVLAAGGTAVIVTADPAQREVVERELRGGRGLSPSSWAHLLGRAGGEVEIAATADQRISSIVVARFS